MCLLAIGWSCSVPTALAVDPEDDESPQLALKVARGLVESGDYRQAIGELHRRSAATPDDADVWNLLGFSYRKLGEYDVARAHYRRALALQPAHLGALEYLGELYLETGQPERARAMLDELSRACDGECDEYHDLARALARAQWPIPRMVEKQDRRDSVAPGVRSR